MKIRVYYLHGYLDIEAPDFWLELTYKKQEKFLDELSSYKWLSWEKIY